ncbi:MAG: ABC transporter substrate-binding protein [Spirochaetota bacterium]
MAPNSKLSSLALGPFLGLVLFFAATPAEAAGRSEDDPPFEERVGAMSWEDIAAEAEGQSLFFYMWGGSEAINRYVTGYLGRRLREEYGVTLEMVPVNDASVFVNKVLGEKAAGIDTRGSVDLVWINGENFRTMKEAGLLFGPYADRLPNAAYVDLDDPAIAFDFGYPVEGYESPFGSAQMVMIHDSAAVGEPPERVEALLDYVRANPGRFTYPAPPDYTGSAFVRHIFYHVAGGYENLLGPFDQALYDEVAPGVWELLNDIEPYLWREGDTYPETATALEDLFANGEVFFDMAYNPAEAANLVAQGRYPESTRTFVFEEGTIGNTHFVAIPYNSPHKAAAMVAANLILDPGAQLEKSRPEVWGDPTVLSIDRLPEEWRRRFENQERAPSVLSPEVLGGHRVPELRADWLGAIEAGWIENVLRR